MKVSLFFLALIFLFVPQNTEMGDDMERNSLAGDWNFYWQQFIIDEVNAVAAPSLMKVPSDWYNKGDTNFEQFGYATYTKQAIVENDGSLGFEIEHIFSSYALFVNGQQLYSSGKVAKSRTDYVPYREPKVISIPYELGDTLNIAIQVANYDHLNSGIYYDLYIGNYLEQSLNLQRKQGINLFLAGGLFITGFILFGASLVSRQLELQVFFFGLFSLSMMYRMMGADPYPLHTLIPGFNFYWAIKSEYLAIHTAAFFGGLFVFRTFQKQTSIWLTRLFYVGSIISILGVVLFPPAVFTANLKYYLFFILAYVLVFIYTIFKATKAGEPGSKILIAALGTVFVWTLFQIVTFLGWGTIPYVMNVVLVSSIIVLCTIALFRTFLKRVSNAREQQAALELAESKNTLLSLISHEIKMPIASLQMNLMMLDEARKNDEILHKVKDKTITKSTEAVKSIKTMINDFLFFMSFDHEIQTEPVTTSDIEAIVENDIKQKFFNLEEKEVVFQSHKITISYILKTLVGNALEHTTVDTASPEIHLTSQNKDCLIEVRDFGDGISDEVLEEIGKSRRKMNEQHEVKGMGFYLAKELCEKLGHELSIVQNSYGGTSVYLKIDLDG